MKNYVKYMSVSDIQMAYENLSSSKPEIINDVQLFTESLVRIANSVDKVVRYNEVRLAMRSL